MLPIPQDLLISLQSIVNEQKNHAWDGVFDYLPDGRSIELMDCETVKAKCSMAKGTSGQTSHEFFVAIFENATTAAKVTTTCKKSCTRNEIYYDATGLFHGEFVKKTSEKPEHIVYSPL